MVEKFKNVHIEFNKSIVDKLKFYNIDSDLMGSALFIIFAIDEKRFDLLDEFDDQNRQRRVIILYRQLERRGLLETTNTEEKHHYQLTQKAIDLVDFVRSEFDRQDVQFPIAIQPGTVAEIKEEQLDWVDEYIALFPAGKFFDRMLRMSKVEARDRLEEFIKKYQYSKDTILKATYNYLKSQEQSPSGHEFTRNSTYFIFKGTGKYKESLLASWCNDYVNSKKNDENKFDTSIMDTV